jgi:hypothetical protein
MRKFPSILLTLAVGVTLTALAVIILSPEFAVAGCVGNGC